MGVKRGQEGSSGVKKGQDGPRWAKMGQVEPRGAKRGQGDVRYDQMRLDEVRATLKIGGEVIKKLKSYPP